MTQDTVEVFRNEMDTFLKALAYSIVEIYATPPSDAEPNATQTNAIDVPLHERFLQELRVKHLRLVRNETPEDKYRLERLDAVNLIHDSIATLAQNRFEQLEHQA